MNDKLFFNHYKTIFFFILKIKSTSENYLVPLDDSEIRHRLNSIVHIH